MKIDRHLDKYPRQEGKRYLVTGSTSGLGYYAARHLAYLGADVILASRRENKLLEARERLLSEFPNAKIDVHVLDQADEASINTFVIETSKDHIDGVIYNAGIYFPPKGGEGLTWKTNALGTYLLSKGLKEAHPEMKEVFVGSLAQKFVKGKGYKETLGEIGRQREYALSKAAVRLLFEERCRQGKEAAFCHPGVTKTGIIRGYAPLIKKIGNAFLYVFLHHVDKAALTEVEALLVAKSGEEVKPRGLFALSGYPKTKKARFHDEKQAKSLIEFLEA